jgi:hypothetical protein
MVDPRSANKPDRRAVGDKLFKKFKKSSDTLWVCQDDRPYFASAKPGLAPLLDYLKENPEPPDGTTVCDRIVGNAAAQLMKKARCTSVYGVMGSEIARDTLGRYGIDCVIEELIPQIMNKAGTDMCPMEKLSLGKEPDEFHTALMQRLAGN